MTTTPRYVLTGLILLSSLSCTLDNGKPWSTVRINANLTWNATERLQDDGHFLTSKNYLIHFEELKFVFRELEVTTSDTETISFDPASPPPGYSLCHQGHCHNDAGKLIPYEQVSQELNSGQSGSVVVQTIKSPIVVDTSATEGTYAFELGACSDALGLCEVGPADISRIGLYLERVIVKANIEDIGDEETKVLTLNADMTIDERLIKQFPVVLGADGPEVVQLDLQANLLPSLWDSFEFSSMEKSPGEIATELFQSSFELILSKKIPINIHMN